MGAIFKRWRWGLFVGGVAFGLTTWFIGEGHPGLVFLNGLAVMAVAFLLVSTDFAALLASPILKFIDSVYLPGGHLDKALLNYDLPLYYERHFRGEEALAAYIQLIRAYPDQINAYAGAVRVCQNQLDDTHQAKKWWAEAERRFGREAVSEAVKKTASEWHAERMRARLAPAPSH